MSEWIIYVVCGAFKDGSVGYWDNDTESWSPVPEDAAIFCDSSSAQWWVEFLKKDFKATLVKAWVAEVVCRERTL